MTGARKRRQAERRGRLAEALASLLLALKGYRRLAHRYRSPVGEIDLVCRKGREIVFVEVKVRATLTLARESITPSAQDRIGRAAAYWLAHEGRDHWDLPVRFDAVLIAFPARFQHLKDAWRPDFAASGL